MPERSAAAALAAEVSPTGRDAIDHKIATAILSYLQCMKNKCMRASRLPDQELASGEQSRHVSGARTQ